MCVNQWDKERKVVRHHSPLPPFPFGKPTSHSCLQYAKSTSASGGYRSDGWSEYFFGELFCSQFPFATHTGSGGVISGTSGQPRPVRRLHSDWGKEEPKPRYRLNELTVFIPMLKPITSPSKRPSYCLKFASN